MAAVQGGKGAPALAREIGRPCSRLVAVQGRGPELAFGSRLDDERAWQSGLIVAPYRLVAYRNCRTATGGGTGPAQGYRATKSG